MSRSTQMDFSRTYSSAPQLWDDGPSYLAKIEFADGSQRIIASGWHARQIDFEYPSIEFAEAGQGMITRDLPALQSLGDDTGRGISRFEIEISLDRHNVSRCIDALAQLIPPEAADALIRSTEAMRPRPSANRANETVDAGSLGALETVDLLAQNMPARAGRMEDPLRHLYRWSRIIALPNGTVSIYKQIDERHLHQLRWPHNGIWLNRGTGYFLTRTVVGDLQEALLVPVSYEDYNLENWRIEYEFWENRPFQILANATAKEAAARLAEAQAELSALSEFLTTAFLAARNLEHRSRTSTLIERDGELREALRAKAEALFARIETYRELLVRGSAILADAAQSVQAIAHQEESAASRFMNTMLAYASAVFLLPTLIISFYSMSIIGGHGDGAHPTVGFVFVLCVTSVVLALLIVTAVSAVLRSRASRRGARAGGS